MAVSIANTYGGGAHLNALTYSSRWISISPVALAIALFHSSKSICRGCAK